MRATRSAFRLNIFLVLLAFSGGCGTGSPPPVEADSGREALRNVLEAWKQGETYEAFRKNNASPIVNDPEWRDGFKLADYKIGTEKESGASLHCDVMLTLKEPKGKTVERKAVYQVNTSPSVTVAREDIAR